MNAFAMENRLLWKEFRVLRLVWLMCALGVTLVMTLFAAIAHTQGSISSYSVGLWGFAVWVPPVYVLAALATMFAGEREEGTLVWLSVLAPPSGKLLMTRLLYVSVTGIALQGCLSAAASLLSQFDQQPVANLARDSLFTMSFLLLEAVVWGAFWSLQTSRPIHAVFYAAATLVLINWGAIGLGEVAQQRMTPQVWTGALGAWGWGRCLLAVTGAAASWPMVHRWIGGRPWEWDAPIQHWFGRRGRLRAITTVEADTPWQRNWQRWRWLERQSLRSFACMVAFGAVLSWLGVAFAAAAAPATVVWLTALIGGTLAWSGDQSQQRYRALVNYGTSPHGLWLNKLLFWSAATLAGVALIAAPSIIGWVQLSDIDPRYWSTSPEGAFLLLKLLPGLNFSYEWMFWFSLTTFAVAFLCSLAIRNVLLAIAAAALSSLVLGAWFLILAGDYLPLAWFAVPIPVWLLWASWRQLPDWWLARSGPRVMCIRLLELTVFPAALLCFAAGYRVREIPFVQLPELPVDDPVATARNVAGWKQIAGKIDAFADLPPSQGTASPQQAAALQAWMAANQSRLEDLRDEILQLPVMAPQAAVWQQVLKSQPRWNLVIAALAEAAVEALNRDRPEDSIAWLKSAFRLYAARRAGAPFDIGVVVTRGGDAWFANVGRWAQHPRQTADTLSGGLRAAADALRFAQCDVTNVLAERAYYDRWDPQFWPWEEARRQRLLNVAAANQLQYLEQVSSHDRLPSARPNELLARPTRTWHVRARSSDGWPYSHRQFLLECPVLGLDSSMASHTHRVEADLRATITVMALAGHVRLHGALPGSLYELEPLLGEWGNAIFDPWINAPFGYEPKGFALPSPEFPPDSALRQPLIWSAGPWHYRVRIQDDQLRATSDVTGLDASYNFQKNFETTYVYQLPAWND